MRLIPLTCVWRGSNPDNLHFKPIWVNPDHIVHVDESELWDSDAERKIPVSRLHWSVGNHNALAVTETPEQIMEACSAQVA